MCVPLRFWLPRVFVACSVLALTGCHSPSLPSTNQTASSQISLTVQQDPAYKSAVGQFSKHDFSEALANIDALLDKPQYVHNPTDYAFLLHQQAICRHAINPHVPTDAASISLPVPRLVPVPLTAAQADCGPRALLLLCPQFGVHTTLASLRQMAGTTPKGTTMAGLAHAATLLGLKAKGVQVDKQALTQASLPAIAWYDSNHYVNLLSVSDEQATIRDPNRSKEEAISTNELLGRSSGILLTLSR